VIYELRAAGELSLACPDEGVWAYVGWGDLWFVPGL